MEVNPRRIEFRGRLARRSCHYTRYSAEDFADAAGHSWHNRASCNRDKPSHQRVLNQILPVIVSPNHNAANHVQVRKP